MLHILSLPLLVFMITVNVETSFKKRAIRILQHIYHRHEVFEIYFLNFSLDIKQNQKLIL
jgi:hypothetical protein